MKTFIYLTAIVALYAAVIFAADDDLAEIPDDQQNAEFGPFENETHRCNFDCSRAIDLCLVLDSSGSIRDADPANWDKVIQFAVDIIDNFDVGRYQTHISVILYSTKVTVHFELDNDKTAEEMKDYLVSNKEKLYIGGWTNTWEALYVLKNRIFREKNGDRPNVPNVAVFLTDGGSSHVENPKFLDPKDITADLEKADIQVVGVGVGHMVNKKELMAISSAPHMENVNYFTTMDFKNLTGIVAKFLFHTCRAICIPKNYICNQAIDLAFIIDSSGSIQKEEEKDMEGVNTNWGLIMTFVKNVIDKFTIGEFDTHIGFVTFSNQGIVRAHLNTSYEAKAVKEVLNNPYLFGNGRTNTYAGLYETCGNVFNGEGGDRIGVPDVAILITDGHSSHREKPKHYMNPVSQAKACMEKGVKLIGIGVTENADMKELHSITSDPWKEGYQTRFKSMDFETLTTILEPFLYELMGQACYHE